MDAATIAMNNEAVRVGSERLLEQMRSEGLAYRMWVTGTDRGSTVHVRVTDLDGTTRERIVHVLDGRGVALDIAEACEPAAHA